MRCSTTASPFNRLAGFTSSTSGVLEVVEDSFSLYDFKFQLVEIKNVR